jgi:hypothetical protein
MSGSDEAFCAWRRSRFGSAIAFAIAVIAWAPGVHARTGPCAAVRAGAESEALPAAWRDALDALVQATAQEGQLWSCPGGSVAIVLDPAGGATLTVVDAKGRTVSRRVARPDEVVPTGEALLASPVVEAGPTEPQAPSPAPPGAAPAAAPAPPPAKAPAAPREPRVQLQALLGPRVSGPGAAAWGSAAIRAELPFGPWSAGIWARADQVFAGPRGAPRGFELTSASAGLSAGRRLVGGPFELKLTLDPSLAIVMMEAGDEDKMHPEGAKVAFRLGASLAGSFHIASVFRGVVAIDGEFAPAGIGGLKKISPDLPDVPVYTAGLLLGIEASIR